MISTDSGWRRRVSCEPSVAGDGKPSVSLVTKPRRTWLSIFHSLVPQSLSRASCTLGYSKAKENLTIHIPRPPTPGLPLMQYTGAQYLQRLHEPVRRSAQRLGRALRRDPVAIGLRQIPGGAQGRLLLALRLVHGRRQPQRLFQADRLPCGTHLKVRLRPRPRRHRSDPLGSHRRSSMDWQLDSSEERAAGWGLGGVKAGGRCGFHSTAFPAALAARLMSSLA